MNWFQNPYVRLAAQVREGAEPGKLQQELSPKLEWLVRRAIRHRDSTSPLGKTIHHEAEQVLAAKKSWPHDSEDLVHKVVDRLWAGILHQLQAGQQLSCQTTWRPAENVPLADRTLVAC